MVLKRTIFSGFDYSRTLTQELAVQGGEVWGLPGQVESGAGRILRRRYGRLAAGSFAQRDHVVGLLARRRFADFVHRYYLWKEKQGVIKEMSSICLLTNIALSYTSLNCGGMGGRVAFQPMSTALHITWHGDGHVVGLLASRRFADFVHRYDLERKAGGYQRDVVYLCWPKSPNVAPVQGLNSMAPHLKMAMLEEDIWVSKD